MYIQDEKKDPEWTPSQNSCSSGSSGTVSIQESEDIGSELTLVSEPRTEISTTITPSVASSAATTTVTEARNSRHRYAVIKLKGVFQNLKYKFIFIYQKTEMKSLFIQILEPENRSKKCKKSSILQTKDK